MSQTTKRVRGKAGAEGVKASRDGARDNWRTPKWLMDVLHQEFGMLWDASAYGPSEWAYGCEDGNTEPDALEAEWPNPHRRVFCNPPFSQMAKWVERIVQHPYTTVTVCKLAPSVGWFKELTSLKSNLWGSGSGWTLTEKGRINRLQLRDGVWLWLLPVRVAYEPPDGIAASSPRFDSCVIVRGER